MYNLQLKADYFLDVSVMDISTDDNGGDVLHCLLLLASHVIPKKEYDGTTITDKELAFKLNWNHTYLHDVLTKLTEYDFIELLEDGTIIVLQSDLWETFV